MTLEELDLAKIKPGKHDISFIANELLDGTQLLLRVGIIQGPTVGPVITIIAAQHGNEWNGTYVCHKLFNYINYEQLNGTIIVLPTANPMAFHQAQRVSMMDNIDMNRVWGLSHRRKPTEHLAQKILKAFIEKSNYVLDLHSGGPGEYALCVAVLQQKWADLAAAFNLTCTMVHEAYGDISSAKGNTSLAHACNKLDVPCLLIELGHGRSIDEPLCNKLIYGINNFLIKVESLKGKLAVQKTKIYKSKAVVASQTSGFLNIDCDLEDKVSKEQPIARITPLFSKKHIDLRAPMDGIVIYKRRLNLVSQGDTIVHIAF